MVPASVKVRQTQIDLEPGAWYYGNPVAQEQMIGKKRIGPFIFHHKRVPQLPQTFWKIWNVRMETNQPKFSRAKTSAAWFLPTWDHFLLKEASLSTFVILLYLPNFVFRIHVVSKVI